MRVSNRHYLFRKGTKNYKYSADELINVAVDVTENEYAQSIQRPEMDASSS